MSEKSIKRPEEFKSLIESLRLKTDKEDELKNSPFKTYAQIMVFSASIGVKLCPQDFKDDYKPYDDPIRFDIFENEGFDGVINILAIYKIGNLNVLTSQSVEKDKKISIFEGYAYAGLKKLQSVLDRPGMTLDNLVEFIKEHIEEKEENQEEKIDLQSLLS